MRCTDSRLLSRSGIAIAVPMRPLAGVPMRASARGKEARDPLQYSCQRWAHVCLLGLMSGLTLGLMSLDHVDLEVQLAVRFLARRIKADPLLHNALDLAY